MSIKIKNLSFCLSFILFLSAGRSDAGLEEKTIGVGIIAGYPTGVSIKTWSTPAGAIDFSLGWSKSGVNNFTGQIAFLRHTFDFFEVESGKLPYYTGIGTRFLVRDPDNASQETRIGLRLIGGLDYIFEKTPTELFFEIGPVLELVPDTELDITAGLGARYYF
ncbi:MAG: hypothetical protein U9R36_00615 [Elusimicrobiota bacterium]|nr:hypothetical protein [Elusimicrobiota bacterium]